MNKEAEQKVYTCSMHPQIIRNTPGQCPICGMDLVEKSGKEGKTTNVDLEFLLKPTNSYVITQIKIVNPVERDMPYEIQANGITAYDTRQQNTVSSRVSGRIDKLYAKYKFQSVKKGDRLASIYSKDLEAGQQNFLYLIKNDPDNSSLINAAHLKLLLMGMTLEQIKEVQTSGRAFPLVTIYSPYAGHLHDVMSSSDQINTSKMPGSGEGMPPEKSQELQLKEGMYIGKGQTLFNVYNTTRLWAVLHIYQDAQNAIRTGQAITIKFNGEDDNKQQAVISFIEPQVREAHHGITVRVNLNNADNNIKVGQIVQGLISVSKKGLFIPTRAVISLGLNKVVFLKDNEIFKAKKIQTGVQNEEWTEVISGVTTEDLIAENGQLLMDSESFIKTTE